MVLRAYATDTILKEIKKCILLCCKCHRLKTAQERGYKKFEDFDDKIIKIAEKCLHSDKPKIILTDILKELNYKFEDLYKIFENKVNK